MDNELIAVEQSTAHDSVSLIKDNETLQQENVQAGLVVKQILHNNPKPVKINGKRHLEYEEWIALGNAYGITVKTNAEPVEIFEAKGFKGMAKVIRVSDGVVIGGAESYCLDDEDNWKNKDYFQMSSMAQTRAGSKALGNQLRGIVALDKTVSTTPAEEMNKPAGKPRPSKPKHKMKAPSKQPVKPKIDNESIEVEATAVEDLSDNKSSMTFKELCDSNSAISKVVKELQANERTVNKNSVLDKLMDLWDLGTVSDDEYKEAKALLE